MKIIHTADLHLDSSMKTHLDDQKAKERKNELTLNFARLCSTANRLGVKAIIIAGDLFDTKSVSKKTALSVLNEIVKNKDIDFYYLRGNHDRESFISYIKGMGDIPSNFKMFSDNWTSYVMNPESEDKRIVLYGAEFYNNNSASLIKILNPDFNDINIVTLHGTQSEYESLGGDIIPLSLLRGRGIDYLALGHIHEYKLKSLDSRGVYCYPGCLEGRGFDECGDHGFMLLDVDEKTGIIIPEFVDFALRKSYTLNIDITGVGNSSLITDLVRKEIMSKRFNKADMLKICLTGDVDENAEVNEDFIKDAFKNDFYFVKVKNESRVKVDYSKYENDESLKGWFIRLVKESDELDENIKGSIVRMGLNALSGEEITK